VEPLGRRRGVTQVTVGEAEAEQRLDRWLRRLHPGVTQGRIEKMCRKGEIRVDGGRVKPATRAAWVALSPVTGRTHQLRAHMAAIGHPVVGDGWGAQLGGGVSRKLHLHARSIAFRHPVTGKRVEIRAPLPEHMARTWTLFGWRPQDAADDPFEALEEARR
jgi:23S rRNA-/tRNA-specific pseudouridylate synthase